MVTIIFIFNKITFDIIEQTCYNVFTGANWWVNN